MHLLVAIQSFSDKTAEGFFVSGRLKSGIGWSRVRSVVKRKLDMLHYANRLQDLVSPPGNRLEPLRRDLSGHHSIRINDQWRIVFRWTAAGPEDVRVIDYH